VPPRLVDGFGLKGMPYSLARDSPLERSSPGPPWRIRQSYAVVRIGRGSRQRVDCDAAHRLPTHNIAVKLGCEKNHEIRPLARRLPDAVRPVMRRGRMA
jgi:hypothetical protein